MRTACGVMLGALVAVGCSFHVDALPGGNGGDDAAVSADLSVGGDGDLATGGGADLAGGGPVDLAAPRDLSPVTGSLAGVRAAIPQTVSLATEGTNDWAHYGLAAATDVNHKAGVTPVITMSSVGTPAQFSAYTPTFTWSGGTPTTSATTNSGIYVTGLNSSFTVTVPADTTNRTLRLYVTQYLATATLTAHLSDGSAVDYTDTPSSAGGVYYRYTLTFRAKSAGQTLQATWKLTTGGGGDSVDLLGATYY